MKIVITPHAAYLDPIKYDADNLGWAVIKRHGKLLMPPSLCFTQNKLNYVKMTSFCFCFFFVQDPSHLPLISLQYAKPTCKL